MGRHFSWLWALSTVALVGCSSDDSASGVGGLPPKPELPTPPGEAPPTGQKWEGIELDGDCGGLGLAWVLVDEVCGGTADPGYLDHFRAPMFRDGARVGDFMYVVDATHLWVVEASDPTGMSRQQLLAGLGEPLSMASYGNGVVLAAGSAGLFELDASDPLAPTISAQVATEGPALDVHVEGDTAYVAQGSAGVAVVDMASGQVTKTLSVPGFAAAVTADDARAYVAACDTLAVVDLATEQVISQTWLPDAYDEEILVAPAKDVEVVDEVLFVAAGRFGAVALDVSVPAQPVILGNCTIPNDPAFYASGVRESGGRLFIAGGEYGILPVDVTNPALACTQHVMPKLPEIPDGDGECSSTPPWEVVSWVETFPPPPPPNVPIPDPAKDPIQTLPFGEVVYAFGDARRIGTRAVDVRDALSLAHLGRYEEPRLLTGIAAAGERVLINGPAGGVFLRDEQALLVPDEAVAMAPHAVSTAMLEDGRWVVLASDGYLYVEGAGDVLTISTESWSEGLAVEGQTVAVSVAGGAYLYDADSDSLGAGLSGKEAALPPAIALHEGKAYVASPEWTQARDVFDMTPLEAHGVFGAGDVSNTSLWRSGLPRRLLLSSQAGLVEVATLGHKAGLMLHGEPTVSIPLPTANYLAGATGGDHVYLIATDRGSYRSQLVTLSVPSLAILDIRSFTGQAADVALSGDRLYVADADRGVRVYDVTSGTPQPLGVVEVSP